MRSLVDLLGAAADHQARELVVHTGQAPTMSGPGGQSALGGPISEADLHAALSAVLSQEQQVELMVGNVVEFQVDARGSWHVLTESGPEGISVRARYSDPNATVREGRSIDLPPVEPFHGASLDLPPLSAADSFARLSLDGRPRPGAPVDLDRGDPSGGIHIELPPEEDDGPPALELSGESLSLTDEPVDFAFTAEPARGAPRPTRPTPPPSPAFRPEAATRRDLVPPPASPVADTRSDLASVRDATPPIAGALEAVVAQLPAAGLCFVHGADAREVAARLGRPTITLDDTSDPVESAARLHRLATGSCAVVRAEDPGRWLAWILRRLEEDYFVFVETRAATAGGAKRVLLGPDASVRAESWLGRHTVRSLMPAEGSWVLVLPQ